MQACTHAHVIKKFVNTKKNTELYQMNYENIRTRPKQFLSVTSLYIEEFDYLLSSFSSKWRNYYRIHTIEGRKRKAPIFNPDKNTKTLPTVEEKLFFILVYLKNYTLQEMMAASFGFSQSQASKWCKVLRPLLFDTLKALHVLPTNQGKQVAPILQKLNENKCFQDVTERLINRPSSDDLQQDFYSGKKKAHTIKNNIITTENQYVVYLSPTFEGTVHDKKIADQNEIEFPDNIHLFQDSGYQGFRPPNVHIVQPFKKPRNKELSLMQKWFNQYVGQRRITVEHAISGIKRLRIVKEKCRHFCQQFREQIIDIAVGLHNFRVNSPFRIYKSKNKWSPNLF